MDAVDDGGVGVAGVDSGGDGDWLTFVASTTNGARLVASSGNS